jgi:serine/threonine protein kinase
VAFAIIGYLSTRQAEEKMIEDRYQILEEIGQGGFAVVYRARDLELDREVALKEMRADVLPNSSGAKKFHGEEQFRQEAKTIAHLDHPHIVTVYDIAEVNRRLFIVMRLVDGPNLDELITAQGHLSWPEAVEIITAVAAGLDYAHANSILHRDLKPANILMDRERGPMLTDFGLAKLMAETNATVSRSGMIVGTLPYIAPEVWEGRENTRQTDIYALGCIFYEMLMGKPLFEGDTPPSIMMAHFNPPGFPASWPDNVPPGLADILAGALAKDPTERYATAGEMVQALVALSTGEQKLPLLPQSVAMANTIRVKPDHRVEKQVVAGSGWQLDAEAVGQRPIAANNSRHWWQNGPWPWAAVFVGLALLLVLVTFFPGGGLPFTRPDSPPARSDNLPISGPMITEDIQIASPDYLERDVPLDLHLDFQAGELNITSGAGEQHLVEGTATYNAAELEPQAITQDHRVVLNHTDNLEPFVARESLENRWDLKLGTTPLNLAITARSAAGNLDLGGLALAALDVTWAPPAFNLSFSEANPLEMETMQFDVTATTATLTGLARANAAAINFEGGQGEYTLDFTGELQRDLDVRIENNFSALTLIVPDESPARVSIEGALTNIKMAGNWEEQNGVYVLPGQSEESAGIFIVVRMDSGSLTLRNPLEYAP